MHRQDRRNKSRFNKLPYTKIVKTTEKHCTKLGGSTTKPADAAAPAAEAEVKAKA